MSKIQNYPFKNCLIGHECKQFVDVWPTPGDVHGGGEGLQHRAGQRHAFDQAEGDG